MKIGEWNEETKDAVLLSRAGALLDSAVALAELAAPMLGELAGRMRGPGPGARTFPAIMTGEKDLKRASETMDTLALECDAGYGALIAESASPGGGGLDVDVIKRAIRDALEKKGGATKMLALLKDRP